MAITILSQPNEFHSGYNPVKYKVTSTNKSKPGFRYVVELYTTGTVKFAEFFIAPDPLDSNNGHIDVSRILQNKLDGFFTTSSFNSENAVGAYTNYQIRFGESYSSEWEFNDYIFLSGGNLGLTTDSAYGAGFSNTPHNYQVGDQIRVRLNGTYTDNRDLLNTFFDVVQVVDTKTIRINGDFGAIGSNPATPGKAVYADNKKAVTYNLANASKTSVNTAMVLPELVATQGSLDGYSMTTGTNNLILTNQPEKYSVTPEQFVFFNVLNGQNKSLIFENSNGDVFRKVIGGSNNVSSLGVGPGNIGSITTLTGTAPLIKDNTRWYTVKVTNNTNSSDFSIEYKFNLDKRCQINDTQIMFMDRKGSYNSFAFQLKRRENVSTTKQTFNKFIDGYSSTAIKGETAYYSDAEKTLDLVTNFMGEQMNMYFEELMTSRNTYVKWEGLWYACIVTDTTFENEFERNNKMINKSIKVKFAVNDPIN